MKRKTITIRLLVCLFCFTLFLASIGVYLTAARYSTETKGNGIVTVASGNAAIKVLNIDKNTPFNGGYFSQVLTLEITNTGETAIEYELSVNAGTDKPLIISFSKSKTDGFFRPGAGSTKGVLLPEKNCIWYLSLSLSATSLTGGVGDPQILIKVNCVQVLE